MRTPPSCSIATSTPAASSAPFRATDAVTISKGGGPARVTVRAPARDTRAWKPRCSLTIAPSLLGEVTHYVADVRKARELLGWQPQTPLDVGIPHAVAWFKEWRVQHPEENRPFVRAQAADEVEHGFKLPAGAGA